MTPSEKLLARLRKDFNLNIPPTTIIRRTRASRNQLDAGAWVWFLWDAARWIPLLNKLGSFEKVSDLLKAKRLELVVEKCGDISLYIKEK